MSELKEGYVSQFLKGTKKISVEDSFHEAAVRSVSGTGKAIEVEPDYRWGIQRIGDRIVPFNTPKDSQPISYQRFDSMVNADPSADARLVEDWMNGVPTYHLNRYIQDNFSLRVGSQKMQLRQDEGTIFFARQLEYLRQRSYDVLYPSVTYSRVLPVDSSAGGGPTSLTWNQYDYTGTPRISTNNTNDIPLAEIRGTQYNQPIVTILMGFQYTFQDIRSALFANKSIDVGRADASRMSVEQYIDKAAFQGDAGHEIPGLLSIAGATAQSVSTVSGNQTWASKIAAGDQGAVLQDMLTATQTILQNTKMTQAPTTMILPISQYALVSTTPRSTNSDTTILNYFMQQNPCIKKVSWSQWMTGASSTGQDVFVQYDDSPDRILVNIPMPYKQHAPVIDKLAYTISTETRYAGVTCFYPNSVIYGMGI